MQPTTEELALRRFLRKELGWSQEKIDEELLLAFEMKGYQQGLRRVRLIAFGELGSAEKTDRGAGSGKVLPPPVRFEEYLKAAISDAEAKTRGEAEQARQARDRAGANKGYFGTTRVKIVSWVIICMIVLVLVLRVFDWFEKLARYGFFLPPADDLYDTLLCVLMLLAVRNVLIAPSWGPYILVAFSVVFGAMSVQLVADDEWWPVAAVSVSLWLILAWVYFPTRKRMAGLRRTKRPE